MPTAHPASQPAGTVLITGAARRIGAIIAADLACAGWRICVHFRNSRQQAEQLAASLEAGGAAALALQADLADPNAAARLVGECAQALGPPVCLINNASEFHYDDLGGLTTDSWTRHMDVNLRAPVLLAQAMASRLPEGVTGNVINLLDQRVLHPTPEYFSYTLSKTALYAATRMLAQALAPRIRVNGIAPGPVLKNVYQTDAEFEAEWRRTLLQRPTRPEEIAAAVRFILDAPSLTGQMIVLDGGQHLVWHAEPRRAPG
jgi:NAD(P)-dependent dehydrogenase (short-subunit alcohol dehydrogenase family)